MKNLFTKNWQSKLKINQLNTDMKNIIRQDLF